MTTETELKALQDQRSEWETTTDQRWKAFCKLVASQLDWDDAEKVISAALNYGQAIRRSEWANDRITALLYRQQR